MRKIPILLLITLLPTLCVAQTEPVSQSESLVFNHVTVIDMTGALPKPDMTVVIVGNHITALGKTGKIRVPKKAYSVDATGKYLIPGLWDMHVHVFNNDSRRPPNEYYFPLFIANGVTGVREMWTKPEGMPQVERWRKQFTEQPGTVPRFGAVGTLVDGLPASWSNSDTVSTADEARRMVAKIKAAGVDFVKVYNNLSREAYFAIADEAKKQRIPFAGHVPHEVVVSEASDAGQRSIEHLTGTNQDCATFVPAMKKELANAIATGSPERLLIEKALEKCDATKAFALYQSFAKNGTWEVPTFPLFIRRSGEPALLERDARLKYIPAHERESWKRFSTARQVRTSQQSAAAQQEFERALQVVRIMHSAGVEFMAGTDVGNEYIYAGFSLHDDLAMFVSAGFTPMEALQTATRNPAKFLGMLDSLGTIEKGKFADLNLLEANPLADINNTRRINAVVVNGRYLPKETLQKMLAKAEAAANKQ
ncbi:MAG: amidohydrolase family protein [Pyrinomonadaceae bacterium]